MKKYSDYEMDIICEEYNNEYPCKNNEEFLINIYLSSLTSNQRETLYDRFKILYKNINTWGNQLNDDEWLEVYESIFLKTITKWLNGNTHKDIMTRKRNLIKFIPLFPIEYVLYTINKMKEKDIYSPFDSKKELLLFELKLEETMNDFWKEIKKNERYFVY